MKKKQEQYRELIAQAEEIRERHREADEWPSDDLERFDKLMDRADELKGQIDRELKADTHLAWASEIADPLPHPDGTEDETKAVSVPRHYTKAFGAWQSEYKPVQADVQKAAVYTKAFDAWVRDPQGLTPEFKAALAEGASATGGAAVPTPLYRELIQAISAAGVMLPLARQIPLPSWKMTVATLTATTAAVLTSEAGAYDEKEPSFGTIDWEAFKFTRLSKASDEALADIAFDVWGTILSPDFANAFALAIDSYATTGTGSAQPQGIVTGGTVGVTTAAATAITADELIDLYHALGTQYRNRPSARFMMHDSTVKYIRKLKEATNDQYLWQPGLQAGQPDTLLGRPLVTNNNMAEIASTAKTAVFADFSFFWLGMREDITIKRLDELYANTGEIGFQAYQRWDSHVMLAAAVQVMQQAT